MIWAMRHPALVLLLTCVVSLLAVMQLPKLQIALSPQSLIIQGDPKQAIYDDMRDTFGSDRITVVYLADPDLLTPAKLREVSRVVETIEQLPFVAKTRSLFSVPDLQVRDELVVSDPFLANIPDDQAALDAILERAQRNPFVAKNLLSTESRSIAINVYLREDAREPSPAFDEQVAHAISQAILPVSEQL